MKNRTLLCLVLLMGGSSLFWADEGRIPLYEPTTLTEPGHYVLTRNIQAAGPVLVIPPSAGVVTIDLNGLFLWRTDNGGPVVDVINVAGDRANVTFRNGYIEGGSTSVNGGDNLIFEHVHIGGTSGAGLQPIDTHSLTMVDCVVANTGAHGIFYEGYFARITRLKTWETGNTAIELVGGGSVVRDSVIDRATKNGISVTGAGNRVIGNTVRNSVETSPGVDGDGIYVEGRRNLIEDNHGEQNPGFGLVLAFGPDNVFRGNVLLGNAGGAVSGGAANIDGGGNVP